MATRGLFISFEGMDGSGKSTQLALLVERMRERGHHVVQSVEPGGSPIGARIRELLLDMKNKEMFPTAEMLLMFAARAQNVDQVIEPALCAGHHVVSDRFTDSTFAYQGAGRGLDENVIRQLHTIACRAASPELTVIVDVDIDVAWARRGHRAQDRMEANGRAFAERVRARYLQMAQEEPTRVHLVNGARDVETIREEIWALVSERLSS
jgi:dTMP kinase